jgi:hypothetical protein
MALGSWRKVMVSIRVIFMDGPAIFDKSKIHDDWQVIRPASRPIFLWTTFKSGETRQWSMGIRNGRNAVGQDG